MADTPDEAQRVNDEILAALLGPAEGQVLHGGPPKLREILTKGDEDWPAPVVARVYEDAGVHRIYDIKTGAMSLTSRNMLPAQVKKLGADGQRMFTHIKPAYEPAPGQHKCHLHADERAQHPEYDEWGLPLCPKANLTSPLQVEQHMRHRHRVEWETIKRQKEEAEKAEERQLQRDIAKAAIGKSK
jgi:hypothetical protein